LQPLALPRLDEAFPATADPQRHQQVELRIGVAREGEWGEAGLLDRDAEFLVEFADQRLFGPLTLVELAAGKFP